MHHKRLIGESSPKSAGCVFARAIVQSCSTSLSTYSNFVAHQTLTSHCNSTLKGSEESFFFPTQMMQRIQEGHRLNWLLTPSLFYLKVFHPTLFWRWIHHHQFHSRFPTPPYLGVYLIDVESWYWFLWLSGIDKSNSLLFEINFMR